MIIIEETIAKKIEKIIIKNNDFYIKTTLDDELSFITEIYETIEISGLLKIYEIEHDKSNYFFDWVKNENTNKITLIITTTL